MSFRDFVSMDFDKSISETPFMVKQNEDLLRPLKYMRFQTDTECLLAISIWLATPVEKQDINHFTHTFKNVLRMIQAETAWSH